VIGPVFLATLTFVLLNLMFLLNHIAVILQLTVPTSICLFLKYRNRLSKHHHSNALLKLGSTAICIQYMFIHVLDCNTSAPDCKSVYYLMLILNAHHLLGLLS
jgi:hypothetical protein